MDKISLFKLPLSHCGTLEMFLDGLEHAIEKRQSLLVSFVNPHAWHVAQQDSIYRSNLDDLDMVLADGIGVTRAAKWIERCRIARLSFDDTSLYRPVLRLFERHQTSLFVAGAAPGVAGRAVLRMEQDFPDLKIAGSHHGHGSIDEAITQIIQSKAQAVLCGMGAPRQEQFILDLKQAGFGGVALTCGGFLDQLILGERYYPPLIDRLELRWLYRLSKEPRRLGRRYLIDYQSFIKAFLMAAPKRLLPIAAFAGNKQPDGTSGRF